MQTTFMHSSVQLPAIASYPPAPRCRSTRRQHCLRAAAARDKTQTQTAEKKPQPGDSSAKNDRRGGLGDLLGPIGLTLGGRLNNKDRVEASNKAAEKSSGVELGPIALSFSEDSRRDNGSDQAVQSGELSSISTMTTEEWRQKYEADGAVDLWVEEEFNSGSRLVGGRDTHRGLAPGFGSGEGPSAGNVTCHTVKIHNPEAGQVVEVAVPEDRYILWEAEDQGLLLPWACRMGCCTKCTVKVLEGEVYQPQALGISQGLKEEGYALMCTSYPRSNAVLEVVEEDEAYDLQFGEAFAAQALDPNDRRNILRDDYALEIADMDE